MKLQSQERDYRQEREEQAEQSQGMKTHEWEMEVCSLGGAGPRAGVQQMQDLAGPSPVLCIPAV